MQRGTLAFVSVVYRVRYLFSFFLRRGFASIDVEAGSLHSEQDDSKLRKMAAQCIHFLSLTLSMQLLRRLVNELLH
jgi:hypothetical protein